jgi:hypothetical protein
MGVCYSSENWFFGTPWSCSLKILGYSGLPTLILCEGILALSSFPISPASNDRWLITNFFSYLHSYLSSLSIVLVAITILHSPPASVQEDIQPQCCPTVEAQFRYLSQKAKAKWSSLFSTYSSHQFLIGLPDSRHIRKDIQNVYCIMRNRRNSSATEPCPWSKSGPTEERTWAGGFRTNRNHLCKDRHSKTWRMRGHPSRWCTNRSDLLIGRIGGFPNPTPLTYTPLESWCWKRYSKLISESLHKQRASMEFPTGCPPSLNFGIKIDIWSRRKALLSIVFDKYNEPDDVTQDPRCQAWDAVSVLNEMHCTFSLDADNRVQPFVQVSDQCQFRSLLPLLRPVTPYQSILFPLIFLSHPVSSSSL